MSGYDTALETDDSSIAGITFDGGVQGAKDFLATVRRRATRIIRDAPRAYYDTLAFLQKLQDMNADYFSKQLQFGHGENLKDDDVTPEGFSRTARNLIGGMAFLYAARSMDINNLDAPTLAQQVLQLNMDDSDAA
ncbi:MAG: hypothetical protein ACRBCT_07860 [Alphaproteobacteria bacterium]